MKFKLLPLSVAVALALPAMATFAKTVETVNIDIANPELQQKIAEQQPVIVVLDADIEVPEGIVFSGYARYGLHYSDDQNKYVRAEGQYTTASAGRLGNEGYGGEFQFSKVFKGANGTIWDVVLMMENWWKYEENGQTAEYGDIALKKFYAGVTNVFESQPNLYIWAGRDFHQRPQQNLNDYKWMAHDGQGTGVYNLELSDTAKLDFAVVAQADGPSDTENYAFTSKLHDIKLSDSIKLSFLFNYGFESATYVNDVEQDKDDAYQIATVLDSNAGQLIIRYAENADNSVFNKTEDLTTMYVSWEGKFNLSDNFSTEYLAAWHNLTNDTDDSEDRSNYSVVVRPMYNWNSIHSTWLEAGYSSVDFDNIDATNSAWKVTLSQNISINAFEAARPMLRFYATVGNADNEVYLDGHSASEEDTLALGAMFESWW